MGTVSHSAGPSREEVQQVLGEVDVELPAPTVARTYLFISFDLVNSTIFKQHSDDWPTRLSSFYRRAAQGISSRISGATVWKYAGDEILFWIAPASLDGLVQCVEATYEVLRNLDSTMSDESKKSLRVKGTSWVALAEAESPDPLSAPNLMFSQTWDGQSSTVDFVGPDIDTGFRVSTCTFKSTLAVSAELAAVLMARAPRSVTKKLHLVGFRKLKGVWKDRHYPIVWFREDMTSGFGYDDKYENPLLLKALKADSQRLDELEKIVEETRPGYVQQLLDGLGQPGVVLSQPPKLEVHCAAVCRRADGHVLMALRPANKRTHPNKWEFGCAQVAIGETFEEALQKDYLADFGISIAFSSPPIALATYSFDRDGRAIPGVILLADAQNPDASKARKHQLVEWIDPAAPKSEIAANSVPGCMEVLARLAARRLDVQRERELCDLRT